MTDPAIRNIIKRTTLFVRDMQASIRWYEYVLGLKVWMDTELELSGVGLAAGKKGDKVRLVILQAEHDEIGMIGLIEWVDPKMDAPDIPTQVHFGMPTFVVASDDAAETVRRAHELGTRVHAEPHEWSVVGAQGKRKHFRASSLFDPDGYFYEVNQLLRVEDEPS